MENSNIHSQYASWIEISESALNNNVNVYRQLLSKDCQLGVVLKANAYGHGICQIFPILYPHIDCFYCHYLAEALQMRSLEKENNLLPKRVILMGPISTDEAILCAENSIEIVVADTRWHEIILPLKKKNLALAIHVFIDTGLTREGLDLAEVADCCQTILKAGETIVLRGVMSQLACEDDISDQSYTMKQYEVFNRALATIATHYPNHSIEKHLAASASSICIPEIQLDMVRSGSLILGLWPSSEARISSFVVHGQVLSFKPCLTWKCRTRLIRKVKADSLIGYSCSYRCSRDSVIAVFPVGYWDGYSRLLTNKAYVLIQGKRCPVIGKVMMDYIIVDVTEITSSCEDELTAVLIGYDGDEQISAEQVAAWSETIHLEVLARLNPSLKRLTVE